MEPSQARDLHDYHVIELSNEGYIMNYDIIGGHANPLIVYDVV